MRSLTGSDAKQKDAKTDRSEIRTRTRFMMCHLGAKATNKANAVNAEDPAKLTSMWGKNRRAVVSAPEEVLRKFPEQTASSGLCVQKPCQGIRLGIKHLGSESAVSGYGDAKVPNINHFQPGQDREFHRRLRFLGNLLAHLKPLPGIGRTEARQFRGIHEQLLDLVVPRECNRRANKINRLLQGALFDRAITSVTLHLLKTLQRVHASIFPSSVTFAVMQLLPGAPDFSTIMKH